MIRLNDSVELPVYQTMIEEPDSIAILPRDMYHKFKAYMLENEFYEYMQNLHSLEDRITDKTYSEILKEQGYG